jgi:quinoprotein glucose dehydrogenase
MSSQEAARRPRLGGVRAVPRWLYGIVLVAIGAALAAGGVRLLALGGSAYYLPAGLAAAVAGLAVLAGRWRLGALVYLLLLAASLVWGLWEAGLNGWALAPRVISPAVLGLPFLVAALVRGPRVAPVLILALGGVLVVAVANSSHWKLAPARGQTPAATATAANDDWPHFGADQGGSHFSPLAQITPANVGQLKVAWRRIIGPNASAASRTEATPLKIGDDLYTCTPFNDVLALDAETGQVRWHFQSHPKTKGIPQAKCRGVAYYAVPGATGPCAERIYTAVGDGRLIALDRLTGALCPGFGTGGQVDLLRGIQQRTPGYYYPTSAPQVIRGKLVLGAGVADNQYVGEPSGVVRAYDAVTGKLAWAWDLGNPGHHGEPPPGQSYTPGTPNAWGPMSADEALGLVYVGTGNATPDYWGSVRSPESNRYSSSVVALDAETGEPRWSFQTTHYDLWDYDVASQPVLVDLKTPSGVVPALIQPTKRGQLFILDRRNGKPLFPVVEKPAPQAGAVERISPTQPWSTALPDFGGPRLTESSMWGITALDQLWCRIRFRESRYEGPLTPPGLTPSIEHPGYIGGMDWGSVSVDPGRQLALLPSNRVVNYVRLYRRSDPFARRLKADPSVYYWVAPQEGTPYAVEFHPFFSPLFAACQQPPYGLLNAVDLRTGKLVWSRPVGSARDLGPMQLHSHLPFTLGTPIYAGTLVTTTGLVFIAGSQDHAFRAFDSETGKLLFSADLPGSSWATPMTYRTRSGRQFVAVSSEYLPREGGDYYAALTAYALPERR